MKRNVLSAILIMLLLRTILVLPSTSASSDINGVWLTHGYGMVMEINDEQINAYDITEVSCTLLFDKAQMEAFNLQFTVVDGELIIQDNMTLYMTAERLDSLPESCTNGQTDDPELNFEAFWHDFNDHYVFFDLHGVDWQAQYDLYRPLVTASTTPNELFAILSDMISPLDDDHISLSNGEDDFSPALQPSIANAEMSQYITLFSTLGVIAQNYLNTDVTFNPIAFGLEGNEAAIPNRAIFYGKISDSVGYINIMSESGYTDDGNDLAAAEEAIDRIVAEFAGLDTVIVDVRINMGGQDGVALALASRFADQKRLVWSKQTRDGDGFTPPREFYVEPGGPQQFTGQVIVLTSPYAVSAGETFILAMEVLPNVTMIGERTAGAYSDALMRVLPNGWQFMLSNEVYTAADGQNYEKIGNPPDIEVAYDLEGFQSGTDTMLEAALELTAQ